MSKIETGIYVEYNDGFIIHLVDEKFVQEELTSLRNNPITLYYVSMGVVDLFLLQIEDSVDTSDIPFCVFDYQNDEKFIESLNDSNNYACTIRYLNTSNEEQARKSSTLNSEFSSIIRKHFKDNLLREFDEDSYEASLNKIQNKYEPFELEEKAVISCNI